MTTAIAATLRNARIRAEARRAYRELLEGEDRGPEPPPDARGGDASALGADDPRI